MKKVWIPIFGLILVLGGLYYAYEKTLYEVPELNAPVQYDEARAVLGNSEYILWVADTDAKRVKGLSGQNSLPENHGLLMIFPIPGKYGIWMKDMKFAIDVLWLDENNTIVHMEENVSPNTFPKSFQSTTDAQYIIELPTDTIFQEKLEVGQTLSISL